MRILIIEDEVELSTPLKKALEKRGYSVDVEDKGDTGLKLALIESYDCIILDLNLPNLDGLEVSKNLRDKNINTPILMLTARTLLDNKVDGFNNGADDYLTKPFEFKELLLRIEALIRRSSLNKSSTLNTDNIKLDTLTGKVIIGDKEVSLNSKEYGILYYLLRNKGKFVTTEELLEHVWNREIDIFTQTVKTNIKTLRKKIDPDKMIIKTVKSRGYIIE